ncbi:MAG: DUF3090 family protein [Acidimicrobiia bacterium]|nr:DUF3090 family protein [Acidimicrobiia bacterium]
MRELGPAERFATGAVGPPGERVFYAHVVANGHPYWFVAEKGQVAALAARALELLAEANVLPDPDSVAALLIEAELGEPGEVVFRIGSMALQIDATELVTVHMVSVEDDEAVSFIVAPEQLQAMALAGLDVVGQGRPLCPDCRLPMNPAGHRCPSSNGHHPE